MVEVLQHLPGGGADVQLRRGDAERLHQPPRVSLGGRAGAEAGHGEAEDVGPRQLQQIHGAGGDDQCMGGVQAAGHPDHDLVGGDGTQPLGQAVDLDVVRLVAVLGEPIRIRRDEREALHRTQQTEIFFGRREGEGNAPVARVGRGHPAVVLERALPGPLLAEKVEVDVGDGELRILLEAGALAELPAVLEDARLPVPGQVGGRLALPGGGVEVRREAPHRLRSAEDAAGVGAADGDRTAGQVGEHGGPGERQATGRRHRHEHVLADLDADGQARNVRRRKQQVGAERGLLPRDHDLQSGDAASRGELAPLVELAVVGQMDLRDDAEDRPPVDHDGGVEQARPVPQWGTRDDHRQQVGAGPNDGVEPLVHGVKNDVLPEQILDGVTGQRQLGEQRDRDAGLRQASADVNDALGITERVGDEDVGGAGCDPGEPVCVQRVERHASSSRRGDALEQLDPLFVALHG